MPYPRKIVFATNSANKLREIREIVGDSLDIVSLAAIGCHDDIPETADTIEGNAKMKAEYIYDKYGIDCFADDTGLEVDALDGAPGVHTARYGSAEGHDPDANMTRLLSELNGVTHRSARFVTCIALIIDGKLQLFRGECPGSILTHRQGNGGFGYDPVFCPDGFDRSFAQMTPEEKNSISHRGRASRQLIEALKKLT